MKVLVIGGGGREHALVWKIVQSPEVEKIFCAPGNAGIAEQAELVPIKIKTFEDVLKLAEFAEKEKIDLTVVGPEAGLFLGIVDEFESRRLTIFGPHKKAAEIEKSKAFSKMFMWKYHIPTADNFAIFRTSKEAMNYIRHYDRPLVVKADGPCEGKGVFPCQTVDEALAAVEKIMEQKKFGEAGSRVVIEDFLTGEEASYVAFTDGETILPMSSSQDHKPVFDGDKGLNTGGMGAYSPAPVVTKEVEERIINEIMKPTIKGLAREGRPYKGALYAGLMISNGRPKVLEFNGRFGDPETQPVLMRMKDDIVPIMEACVKGNLSKYTIEWNRSPAVCVVMVSGGYPGDYQKGKIISGLDRTKSVYNSFVFHAGTAMKDGQMITNGGRVLGPTALGLDIGQAIDRTYKLVEKILWDGVYYRKDIGQKALRRN
jgi:phosphoribosylamine--glycine ligase